MNLLRTAIGTAALVASLALPPLTAAGSIVPPGNSAATQYTETFPTTGGNAEVNSSIGGGGAGGGGQSAAEALGSRTAHTLEQLGQEGRNVAALATESVPPAAEGERGPAKPSHRAGGSEAKKGPGSGDSGQLGPALAGEAPGGSSGFGEVLSQATGSTSGQMGIFLPLVLVAALLWGLAYAWRQRQPGQAPS
ncbi:MAG: hypothetical protein U0R26_08560 [Solirubrobacterales bacterium]